MPLHVLGVLLFSVYRAFSCSLPFLGFPPSPPLFFIVIHYLPSRFSTGLSVQFDRGWGRVFLVSGACGWISSRVGSWVF